MRKARHAQHPANRHRSATPKRRHGHVAVATLLLAIGASHSSGAETLRLSLPIACDMQSLCFVQNFVDRDPSGTALDYRCGHLTYHGHDGTDFAVPDLPAMQRGIAVLAAAAGTVRAVRDGMPDISIRDPNAPPLAGRDCGNGVVIVHGDGWETQYCHLRRNSIRVKPGQAVAAGAELALVGMSGRAEFPHVHLALRHDGKPVDPFSGTPAAAACGRNPSPLWTEAAATALQYRPGGIIDAGFATAPPTQAGAEAGQYAAEWLPVDASALIFWVREFGAQPGEIRTSTIFAPDGGKILDRSEPPGTKPQARHFLYVGIKRGAKPWPAGHYRAAFRATVIDGGRERELYRIERTIELR